MQRIALLAAASLALLASFAPAASAHDWETCSATVELDTRQVVVHCDPLDVKPGVLPCGAGADPSAPSVAYGCAAPASGAHACIVTVDPRTLDVEVQCNSLVVKPGVVPCEAWVDPSAPDAGHGCDLP